jgi:ProP effector
MKSFELRQLLAERYPNAFKPKGAQKLPLKIGIHNEIVAANPELTAEEVRAGLADYTGGPKYLEHLLPGAVRIGLDGSPAGTVTEREANWARIRLKHLRATWRAQGHAHEFKAEGEP